MSDAQLAVAAGLGDDQAFEQLVRQLRPLIWSCAQRFYGPGLDRDDLYQAAVVGLWRGCRSYDPERAAGDFGGWAAMCMNRQLVDALKTAKRMKHHILDAALSLEQTVGGEDPDAPMLRDVVAARQLSALDELVQRDRIRALVAAIGDLPDLEREALVGIVFNGESYVEVEERVTGNRPETARSVKAVDNALQRAKVKLRFRVLDEDERLPLGAAA